MTENFLPLEYLNTVSKKRAESELK